MKITFVQNEKEKAEADRAIRAGLSLRKSKIGTWILHPSQSVNDRYVVVDSTGKEVYLESFKTIDGALLYALGIRNDGNKIDDWDRQEALRDNGSFSEVPLTKEEANE